MTVAYAHDGLTCIGPISVLAQSAVSLDQSWNSRDGGGLNAAT